MSRRVTHILAVRLSALGDVAMCIPAVYSFARQYPQCRVSVLTRPQFAGLFVNRPGNISIVGADVKGRYKGFYGLIRLLLDLRKQRFDAVADLHNVLRSWLIDSFFIAHGVRVAMVDKGRRDRRRILSHEYKGESVNFTERYARVFARMGFPVRIDFKSVYGDVPPQTPIRIPDFSVGIAPFARYFTKTYPVEMMRIVAAGLARRGYMVYLFGGGSREKEVLERWDRELGNCVSLAGRYTLEQEMAIMSRLRLMITMDSANQHIASLAGVEVITVWGGTTPSCGFIGHNQSIGNALCLGLPCQPCSIAGGKTCRYGGLECLRHIDPQTIIEKTERLIHKK